MQNMPLSVHFPTQTTDAGLCLLKYAHLLASMNKNTLNNRSFDDDGHENALGKKGLSSVSNDAVHHFRLDFLKLICEVTCKFHTVKNVSSQKNNQCGCNAECDCTTDVNNRCDVEWDDDSVNSGHTSLTCASSISNHSDSTYRVPANEEDKLDVSNDMSNSDDDSSVEEMHSDFMSDYRQSLYNSNDNCDDLKTDNLVSPGDVLEYCTIDGDQTARRCSVETIIDSDHKSYLILKNGTVLHPTTHSVRRIKFYDEYNHDLIPNPLSEWHRLDKCILQSGSMNHDNACFDDDGDGDDGSESVTNAMDDGEVYRVREQRRRQNKQRYGF